MAVGDAIGPYSIWAYSDIKPASEILMSHHVGFPNLGDMKQIDYSTIPPIDLMLGSWPCQPHSSAGLRRGEEDPRDLWPEYLRAIKALKPAIWFGENVARVAGNGELRRVTSQLAEIGYVGAYRLVRASDIGACHKRDRCFIVAIAPDAYRELLRNQPGWGGRQGGSGAGIAPDHGGAGQDRVTLLPTPTKNMSTGPGTSGREGGMNLQTAVTLLPTPTARDWKTGRSNLVNKGGTGRPLSEIVVNNLVLPTPTARLGDASSRGADASRYRGPNSQGGRRSNLDDAVAAIETKPEWMQDRTPSGGSCWGNYEGAIRRHELTLGREAPSPISGLSRNGVPQLSPRFVEWMMMLPEGHVDDVPGLTRTQKLSLLGDGVVPAQGAYAFKFLLNHLNERVSA
jgi:DNA (cytosine-5)-methyltransferase 1